MDSILADMSVDVLSRVPSSVIFSNLDETIIDETDSEIRYTGMHFNIDASFHYIYTLFQLH